MPYSEPHCISTGSFILFSILNGLIFFSPVTIVSHFLSRSCHGLFTSTMQTIVALIYVFMFIHCFAASIKLESQYGRLVYLPLINVALVLILSLTFCFFSWKLRLIG